MDAEAEFLESRPPGSRNARRWKCASIRKPYRKRKVFFSACGNSQRRFAFRLLGRTGSASLVHILVIAQVIPARHIVQPRSVVQIPADSLLDTLSKLEARLPSQLVLQP